MRAFVYYITLVFISAYFGVTMRQIKSCAGHTSIEELHDVFGFGAGRSECADNLRFALGEVDFGEDVLSADFLKLLILLLFFLLFFILFLVF